MSVEVVVVGGSGFIGTRLCARLQAAGRTFAIIDRRVSAAYPNESSVAEAASPAFAAAVPPSTAIVNLAAEHRDDVRPTSRYEEVNVGGARDVCAVASRNDVRLIVFSSSVAVYGDVAVDADERAVPRPASPYGRSKLAAEQVYRRWQAEDPSKRTLVVVRPAAVFGEGGRGNVNLLLSQVAASRFVMVGDGRNVKSLAYVENVAAFIEFALSFTSGVHVYNYVDKPDLPVHELIAFVRAEAGRTPRVRMRVPYAAAYLVGGLFDVARFVSKRPFAISAQRVRKFGASSQFGTAIGETGFVPPVPLREGLAATVRHVLAERRDGAR
ncbi:MAG: NAD-dependent epimerase/dehydratase family protein [Gammaproteobacteria bacterium]|nr:NAD-dependent epimerase/dehydratase family protein [Gammaproteobacteria bacterium]